jgi:4-diphosphocytidyl-2-C-methyl-D-erythritol kinase
MFEIYKSYAKINLFLKITGIRGNYHEFSSRFLKVYSLYDELTFYNDKGEFQIQGFHFPKEQNIIYKTLQQLYKNLDLKKREKVKNFFENYSLSVKKNIPEMGGLGGGSSNSATFLEMIDNQLSLNLTLQDKINIVKNIGADIIFFLYSINKNINSANVKGIGDIIIPLDESPLNIDIFTPQNIKCNTKNVYQTFRNRFFNLTSQEEIVKWEKLDSKELFKNLTISNANDLYSPAKYLCSELGKINKNGYLFSGSGSSFFKIQLQKNII